MIFRRSSKELSWCYSKHSVYNYMACIALTLSEQEGTYSTVGVSHVAEVTGDRCRDPQVIAVHCVLAPVRCASYHLALLSIRAIYCHLSETINISLELTQFGMY